MTLWRKLVLFAALAAAAPLVGVAFAVLAAAERAMSERLGAEHAARAASGAAAVAASLTEVDLALAALLRTFEPSELTPDELRGLLAVLSRQAPATDASAVLDAGGEVRAVVDAGEEEGGRAGPAFAVAVRRAAGQGPGAAVLVVYEEGPAARIAAVRASAPARGAPWLVGARLRADHLARRLAEAAPPGGVALLLGADGSHLAAAPAGAVLDDAARAEAAALAAAGRPGAARGAAAVAGFAPLPDGGGLGVLVATPAAAAYAETAALRRAVLGASAAVLALVLALAALFARRLGRRLAGIEGAARALAGGDLAVRAPAGGRDEIARVADTFNAMAGELQVSRARLESWNADLAREVEARTRDLEAAQARLLEARKLAAVGQLGAGVAHELNNPLTGILGHAQLLLEARPPADPDHETLLAIERLARRCRDVTQRLLRFSQQGAEPRPERVELNHVAEDAVALGGGAAGDDGVPLDVALASPSPPVRGDPGHLAQVVLALLANARTACAGKPGARVRLETRTAGDRAELVVRDGGRGIAPEHLPRLFEPFFTTKPGWRDVGLGLSVAYRIVADHGGEIAVESAPGEGSAFTVRLPLAGPEV